ncbi:hypothetical protein GCM10027446_03930 [Angustibacter peucedani]
MRRRPIALLAAAAAAAAVLASPAQASAAAPIFTSATSAPGHPELLVATLTAGVEVASVTATITTPDGDEPVVLERQGTSQTWQSAPVQLASLGRFPTTVVATPVDAGGMPATTSFTLRYLEQPVVDEHQLTAPAAVTFDDHTASASGRLLVRDPRTGATAPAVGERVELWRSGAADPTPSTVTGGDGRYALSLDLATEDVGRTGNASFHLYWMPTTDPDVDMPDAELLEYYFPLVRRSTARIVLDQHSPVDYPAKAPVSGQLQRWTGSAWIPTSGPQIRVTTWDDQQLLAATDAEGRFSLLVPNRGRERVETMVALRSGDGSVLLQPVGATNTPAYQAVAVYALLPVRDRTSITLATRDVGANSTIRIAGRLTNLGPGENDRTAISTQRLYLEQSSNGKTGWHSLGYLLTDKWSRAGSFDEQAFLEHPSGYLRLSFRGNATLRPVYSKVLHVHRVDTRVVHLDATPEPVRKGAAVVVRGTVQRLSGGTTWVHLGSGQEVQVFFRAKGSNRYSYQGSTRTTSSGSFRFNGRARSDGYWTAVWFTRSSTYINAYGADDYVDVR